MFDSGQHVRGKNQQDRTAKRTTCTKTSSTTSRSFIRIGITYIVKLVDIQHLPRIQWFENGLTNLDLTYMECLTQHNIKCTNYVGLQVYMTHCLILACLYSCISNWNYLQLLIKLCRIPSDHSDYSGVCWYGCICKWHVGVCLSMVEPAWGK